MDLWIYSGYMMLWLIYASSLVIFKHISESMTCGLFGLLYIDEMVMKILHWKAWKAYFLLLCSFPAFITVLACLRLL